MRSSVVALLEAVCVYARMCERYVALAGEHAVCLRLCTRLSDLLNFPSQVGEMKVEINVYLWCSRFTHMQYACVCVRDGRLTQFPFCRLAT